MHVDKNNMYANPVNSANDIVFEVTQESDGGYCAECLTESIFTQADTWDELRAKVGAAVEAFHFDRPRPFAVHLSLLAD